MSYRDIARKSIAQSESLRLKAYRDSMGLLTIGFGRLIDEGGGITPAEASVMLENDLAIDENRARAFFPSFESLTDNRKACLMDMAHCLRNKLGAFVKLRAAVASQDWEGAAAQILDSTFAKQTGTRAVRLADMMKKG